jgi:trimeric autotransporter adhesin
MGGEPIYQWQKDGVDIPGATQASYVIPAANINFDHSGVYSSLVRGTGGAKAVRSEEVLLYVLTDPEITRQPETVVVDEGGTADFEVQAHIQLTGFPIAKLHYQWYKGDLNNPLSDNDKVAGSDASILTIRHIETTDYGTDYFVVITGLCGSVTSNFVGILPQPDVAITGQPIDATDCEGTSSVFTVMAEIVGGGQSLSYQWYKNGMELIDDAKISGSDTPVLMISNLELSDEGVYTVMVTVTPGREVQNHK